MPSVLGKKATIHSCWDDTSGSNHRLIPHSLNMAEGVEVRASRALALERRELHRAAGHLEKKHPADRCRVIVVEHFSLRTTMQT